MAFGQELRDFVAGFKTGYELIDSPEEKEEKRAERRRKQESHELQRENYQRSWDAQDWRRNFSERDWEWRKGVNERDFAATERERGLAHGRWEETFAAQERKRLEDMRRETGVLPEQMEDYEPIDPYAIQDDEGGDEVSYNAQALYQPASYSPESAAEGAAFNLQSYLSSIRSAESGGNDRARNQNSTAAGRYQFLDGTWNDLARKYPSLGLTPDGRFDPEQQERAIRRFTYDNGEALERAGIPVTNGTMYAAHFLGSGDATRVLRAPRNAPIERLVSPKVIKANPFLRGMTVGDFEQWAERKAGGGRRPRAAINAARGGLVEPVGVLPEEEEEVQVAEVALPEEAPMPTPRPEYDGGMEGDAEEPTDDPWELGRRAVRDGMKVAMQKVGIDQETAIDDPNAAEIRNRYIRGYGAAPEQMMRQVIDKIDPERKMSPAERNMMAMGTVYRFYMDNGEVEKAKEAAMSMVQYYRRASQQFLALGQAAAEEGDLDKAAMAAVAAYANVPNGRDMSIEKDDNGNFVVSVTDAKTGKRINRKVMPPREFAAAAMQFNPTTFDEEILNAAGVPAEKFDDPSFETVTTAGDNASMAVEELLSDSPLNDAQKTAVRDIAAGVSAEKTNRMDPEQAVRFVTDLIAIDSNPTEDGSPNLAPGYTVESIRGNPDRVRVKKGEQSVVMTRGQLEALIGARSVEVEKRTTAFERQKKDEQAAAQRKEKMRQFRDTLKSMRPEERAIEAIPEAEAGARIGAMVPEAPVPAIPEEQDEVQRLLDLRDTLLAEADGARRYAKRLEMIEERLRELGHLETQ